MLIFVYMYGVHGGSVTNSVLIEEAESRFKNYDKSID